MEPCELHDLWPCALCDGSEKRFEESLTEPDITYLVPGVVAAQYVGHCARCGWAFGVGSPIRFSEHDVGWVALACCG